MKRFDIKEQIKNKYFWMSVVSLIVLCAQQFGLDFIPKDLEPFANSVLTILVTMGIITDNTTPGIGTGEKDENID